ISFGTGGIRGIMGVGINRINIYTIRKATFGFASYLKKHFVNRPYSLQNVVISYDTRQNSYLFAKETARVLASQNFHVYLFKEPRPTPQLSFAVRYLKAVGGIIITASHNPPNYNGYKVYDENGCQLVPHKADLVSEEINLIEDLFSIQVDDFETYLRRGSITILEKYFDENYLTAVRFASVQRVRKENFKIVYTPLHGTGNAFGESLLSGLGYDVYSVKEQMEPDHMFSTVTSPNPEDPKAFKLAVELAQKVKAQLILATDPDADRCGAAVLVKDEYYFLSGNEIAVLILDYLIKFATRIRESVFISTIVTTDLVFKMAEENNLEIIKTLTGFKFIGEQIELIKKQRKDFFFGCEESFGYLVSDLVRDKDAFQACLIISELTAYYHEQNLTLIDVLKLIYEKYGYYQETLINVNVSGVDGLNSLNHFMESLRKDKLVNLGDDQVLILEDYLKQIKIFDDGRIEKITLPPSDVLKYVFSNGWIVFRPSGTEPKLKVYLSSFNKTEQKAKLLLEKRVDAANKLLRKYNLIK
ncbi:MAG: phospho-sugar mutase, partial [Bacilli bacterium]|nr:phospho-sugar mutase [Bacilli bacterium]